MTRGALALAAVLLAASAATAGTTDHAIPTPDSHPEVVAVAPEGHACFTEEQANRIGRITPAGQITARPGVSYSAPGAARSRGATAHSGLSMPGPEAI